MARPLRIEYPDALYHITSRGQERGTIFSDDKDRWHFVDVLAENLEYYEVTLYAYVLMENHYHLVARTARANLNRFMHDLNGAYSTWYNVRHDRAGHMFQGRYKAIVMEEENYLLTVAAYVHLNPVRIKTVKQKPFEERVRILDDYPWSSWWDYTRALKKKRTPPVLCDVVWGELGVRTKAAGRSRFREYALGRLMEDPMSPLKEVKRQTYLGSEGFGRQIEEMLFAGQELSRQIVAHEAWSDRPSAEAVMETASRALKLPAGSVTRRTRYGRETRDLVIYLCREISRAEQRAIAQHFGIGQAAVSLATRRVRQAIATDRRFKRRVEKAQKTIINMLKT
ncbi:MAG: transposase [Kiritimatiellae bacterium]|nr:transposase [Kiritimatiellia bacterium]